MELFLFDHTCVLHNQSQDNWEKDEWKILVSIHSSRHLSLHPVSQYRSYMEQDKSTFLWVPLHYYDLKRHWICGAERMAISPSLMHTHTLADTLTHTTAASLFRVQSLTLLAEGTSNHNCKLIVCLRRWLQHHSHPRLNTSSSSVIAAIVIHSTRKEQLWMHLLQTYRAEIRECLILLC